LLLAGAGGLIPSLEGRFHSLAEQQIAVLISFLGLCIVAVLLKALYDKVTLPAYEKFLIVDEKLNAAVVRAKNPQRELLPSRTGNLMQLWAWTLFLTTMTCFAGMLVAFISVWWTMEVIQG
jgi:hypothetical protein